MMLMLLLSNIVKLANPIFFLIISNIFSVCYVTFKLRHFFYGSFSFFNFQQLESVTFLKNSLPMFASALLVMPVMFYGNYLLSSSASLDDSVVYNLAFQWRNIVSIVPAAMLQAFLPLIVKTKGSAKFSCHMLVIFISSLFLILLLSFILIGKIDFIYGDVVSGYTSVFYYMILSSVLASFSALFGQYFFANGNYKMCFLMNLVWAIIFLLLLEYVELSAESVALSLAQSYLVLFFFQLILYFLKGKKYGFA
jgi:O-antigen/teichoic acid export membrane protein